MVENRIGQFEKLKDSQFQVFTQKTLKRANDRAVKLGLNRSAYRGDARERSFYFERTTHKKYPALI